MNYIAIDQFDTANGIGIGTVLWVAGCNHHCPQCHNPQTHDPTAGKLWTDHQLQFVLKTLEPRYITRFTISGGDPLFPANRAEVGKILSAIKSTYPQKSIWLYTGYLYDQVKDLELMRYVDVLVDGPFLISQKSVNLEFRGSANQRIIHCSHHQQPLKK